LSPAPELATFAGIRAAHARKGACREDQPKSLFRASFVPVVLCFAFAPSLPARQAFAQQLAPPQGYDQLATDEAAANAQPGPRKTPARTIPIPTEEVSPELKALIALPFPPHMNAAPKDAAEWKALISRRAALAIANLPAMREKLGVTVEPTVIAGVKAFIVTPKVIPPAILTTGTRDLFLSNTVRTHRKLRRAGVEAELNVYEGMSHAQYGADIDAPQTKEAFTDIARFFDKHLGK
jgi:hypothetical protein